ncbi:MAG: AAA family ATPase [Deltaproteobacteria bacterium]|nr:AAA family ATPase [Deltaproteobacteria bacterium]
MLRHPGTAFHALDLTSGIASEGEERPAARLVLGQEGLETGGFQIGGLGDAGEVLDDQAKREYRQRLSELREELEEAKGLGKAERAEELEAEIDALTRELARAVGLGGRSRRAAAAAQRARQAVRKAIKAALDRISQSHAEFGRILSQSIRTGHFCSYRPTAASPIKWQFAGTEPSHRSTSDAPSTSTEPSSMALEFLPFSAVRRTAFVNRENECRVIEAAIADARNGRGSVMMVGGGPGVGKTRLAIQMGEYASRIGFASFIGRCNERQEPVPFLPFVDIIESMLARASSLDAFRDQLGGNAPELAQLAPSLRRVFQDIPEPIELPNPQKRHYIFQSVTEALARAARTRPQLFILDDLQWADESTLALLNYLTGHIGRVPLAVIGTYRDEHCEENSAFARTLEELIRQGVRPLRLSGLSKDSVTRMLDDLSQRRIVESLVEAIFAESDGNPFFVEEVYRHLLDEGKIFDSAGRLRTDLKIDEIEVPENVRLILTRRLKRFSDREIRALSAAAVIGRSFSFRLLAAISQIEFDELFAAIEKAQEMGIVVPSAEGPEKPFTFAHELVRQTLLAQLSIARRQQLHAKVAAALESLDPKSANEHAGEISDHLVKAGSFADSRKLVSYLTIGGKRALDAAAFGEARESCRTALSEKNPLAPHERAELLVNLAMAERGLNHWDSVVANLREALEIFFKLGDRKTIAWIVNESTDALFRLGRNQEAIAWARRGLDFFGAEVSPERARLFATLGWAYKSVGDYKQAQEAMRDGLNIASQLSDPKLEAELLGVRSEINTAFSHLREAVEDGLQCEQLAGSDQSPWHRARRLFALDLALLHLGRVEDAMRIADQLEPLARKMRQFIFVAFCGFIRALVEFGKEPDLGKLAAAFKVAFEDQQSSIAGAEALFETRRSQLDFLRGDWARAMSHAQIAYRGEVERNFAGYGAGMLFRVMSYAGDRKGALALLEETRALLPHSGRPNEAPAWVLLLMVIEGLVVLGEHSQAGQFYPLVQELIEVGAIELFRISHFSQTIAGLAAGAAQRWEAAEDHFRMAMEQAESLPDSLEQAEIRRFHAMMLLVRDSTSDRARAQALLGEALESYTRIGMRRHAELTRVLLGRTD